MHAESFNFGLYHHYSFIFFTLRIGVELATSNWLIRGSHHGPSTAVGLGMDQGIAERTTVGTHTLTPKDGVLCVPD